MRLELVVRVPRTPGCVTSVEAAVQPLGCDVVVQEVEAERIRVAVRAMVHPSEFAERQRQLWATVERALVAPAPNSPA